VLEATENKGIKGIGFYRAWTGDFDVQLHPNEREHPFVMKLLTAFILFGAGCLTAASPVLTSSPGSSLLIVSSPVVEFKGAKRLWKRAQRKGARPNNSDEPAALWAARRKLEMGSVPDEHKPAFVEKLLERHDEPAVRGSVRDTIGGDRYDGIIQKVQGVVEGVEDACPCSIKTDSFYTFIFCCFQHCPSQHIKCESLRF